MRDIMLGLVCTCSAALVTAPLAPAQEGSPLGFVNKLGQDLDVRSGGRVLADEILSGKVILPELATPIAGVPAIPQIQLRGGNQQANDPGLDYLQIFAGFRPFVRATQSETSAAAFGQNIVVTYNNSAGLHVSPNFLMAGSFPSSLSWVLSLSVILARSRNASERVSVCFASFSPVVCASPSERISRCAA